jgi:hypothetical protein
MDLIALDLSLTECHFGLHPVSDWCTGTRVGFFWGWGVGIDKRCRKHSWKETNKQIYKGYKRKINESKNQAVTERWKETHYERRKTLGKRVNETTRRGEHEEE